MKVAVALHDRELRERIIKVLRLEGYVVDERYDDPNGAFYGIADSYQIDLVVLEVKAGEASMEFAAGFQSMTEFRGCGPRVLAICSEIYPVMTMTFPTDDDPGHEVEFFSYYNICVLHTLFGAEELITAVNQVMAA